MDTNAVEAITDAARTIAEAIARRDRAALQPLLAPGFVHRTHGGPSSDGEAFLSGIEQIPGEIRFVRLDHLVIDVCGACALVTGVQHAQVVIDGNVIDDKRGFVDWFVQHAGEWRIQAAVDLPAEG